MRMGGCDGLACVGSEPCCTLVAALHTGALHSTVQSTAPYGPGRHSRATGPRLSRTDLGRGIRCARGGGFARTTGDEHRLSG